MNEVIWSQVFHLGWQLKRIMARDMSYFTAFCLQQHDFQSGSELLPVAAGGGGGRALKGERLPLEPPLSVRR